MNVQKLVILLEATNAKKTVYIELENGDTEPVDVQVRSSGVVVITTTHSPKE